ncbi:MAG: terpene cyclase/mutase family protein, partial [Planctomycetes bacterium]|nr:terpene cyclase/mutase family protein [Planctomycetota bacterium]
EEEPEEIEELEPLEEPVLKDAEISDHNETEDNQEYESSEGDPDFLSDSPFDDKAFNDVIGIGGGAGGKFGGRFGGKRNLRAAGGSGTEQALKDGLEWLANHQDDDGKWDTDEFMKHDPAGDLCDGPGQPEHDVGVTGLALLAFLGDGHTTRAGIYKERVTRGIKWLRDQQDFESGLIGEKIGHSYMYSHGIASLAMCEAYYFSKYKILKKNAQLGINYLERHRNPYSVWRYQPRDNDNDTSVTTWAAMALCSGRSFGLQVNPNAVQMIGNWYDQVTDDKGRSGYTKVGERSSRKPGDHSARFPVERGEALTAAALLGRFMIGQEPASKAVMAKSAGLLLAQPPQWQKDRIDAYYWFFGSFAMYQMGGEFWEGWAPHLAGLLTHQRQDGNFAGSWDPVGVWDEDGGRIYATALYSLALQTAQRKAKLVRAPQMIR